MRLKAVRRQGKGHRSNEMKFESTKLDVKAKKSHYTLVLLCAIDGKPSLKNNLCTNFQVFLSFLDLELDTIFIRSNIYIYIYM
jgi:hypothetical protein